MNKAVFFDRDGVINSDEGLYYIYKLSDFKLNEGIVDNMKLLSDAGFVIIIVSNQGGIGKGLYAKKDTELIHDYLRDTCRKENINLGEIYFCPHHNETGLCLCRKPGSLMIEKAIARFNIDPEQSFLIGDGKRDIEAANNAGIKGFLVEKNTNVQSTCNEIIRLSKTQ
jgi:D-glycero-D-manno-heptose 1,7-bisphosphate phosphatase